MEINNHDVLLSNIYQNALSNQLIKIIISKTHVEYNTHFLKHIITPYTNNKTETSYKVESFTKTQSFTESFALEGLIQSIKKMITTSRHTLVYTNEEEQELLTSKKGKTTLIVRKKIKQSLPIELNHDRNKNYQLDLKHPIWMDLGIVSSKGFIEKDAGPKRKQIQRYLDLLHPVFQSKSKIPKTIVDLGCGKGYLTFALHLYLLQSGFNDIKIIGIELREDLANFCNQLVSKYDFKNLEFVCSNIDQIPNTIQADLVIALHACDTATDDAIQYGIDNKSQWIISAPCCHKFVRKNMTGGQMKPYLVDGIMKERMAEWLTDTMRKLYLESLGYDVTITEFVSPEHTSKNLMIVAKKTNQPKSNSLDQMSELMQMWGINQWVYPKKENDKN